MDHRGLGCWWTVDDVGARIYGLEENLDFVYVGVDNIRVAGLTKREHLELAITKRLAKVLNVIPWISPKRRRARPM